MFRAYGCRRSATRTVRASVRNVDHTIFSCKTKRTPIMTSEKHASIHWGITAKLTTLIVLFGFVPMAIVGLIAYNASLTIEGSVGTRFQSVAEGIARSEERRVGKEGRS